MAKSETPLKTAPTQAELRWPFQEPYDDLIGYTSLGEMYVRNDVQMATSTRAALVLAINNIVKLNHSALIAARQAAMDSADTLVNRSFPNRTASLAERKQLAADLLAQAILEPFISVRVARLCRQLGIGR